MAVTKSHAPVVTSEGVAALRDILHLFRAFRAPTRSSAPFVSATELLTLGAVVRRADAPPELRSAFVSLALLLPAQSVDVPALCTLVSLCIEFIARVKGAQYYTLPHNAHHTVTANRRSDFVAHL